MDGHVSCSFIASKSRVAPLTPMTIPRLELMGCLILSRMMKTVREAIVEFEINSVFCWSDSSDCLAGICAEGKVWKRLVQNLVREIRDNVPDVKWGHCPGKKNPSDIPTRGIDIANRENCEVWLQGPDFLSMEDEKYHQL